MKRNAMFAVLVVLAMGLTGCAESFTPTGPNPGIPPPDNGDGGVGSALMVFAGTDIKVQATFTPAPGSKVPLNQLCAGIDSGSHCFDIEFVADGSQGWRVAAAFSHDGVSPDMSARVITDTAVDGASRSDFWWQFEGYAPKALIWWVYPSRGNDGSYEKRVAADVLMLNYTAQ